MAAVWLALMPAVAVAAELVSGDDVRIASPVNDDLYVIGTQVTISAPVYGDVIASGASVRITGDVHGSVYAAGYEVVIAGVVDGVVMVTGVEVTLRGRIGGAVRVAARTVRVRSSGLGGDLVVAASSVSVDSSSTVAGDLIARSGTVRAEGDIAGEVRGRITSLELGGRIGGPVDVRVGTLRFTEGAIVSQPVRYTSDHEVLVDGGTEISAVLTRVEPEHATRSERVTKALVWAIFRFMWAFALGVFLLRVAGNVLRGSAQALRGRPLPALGWGLLGIVATPVAILLLLFSVIGLPIALVLLAAFVLAIYASQIVLAMLIGSVIAPRRWRGNDRLRDGAGVLALGLAVVVGVRALPLPGWYIFSGFTIAVAALGSLVLQIFRRGGASAERSMRPFGS